MNSTLRTMIHYTVIPKDITTIEGNNKLEAILVYSYIKSREDYTTHSLDNLTYEEISHHLNIPPQTVKNIVPTLYRNTALFKGYDRFKKDEKSYLIYYFHETYSNFYYIDNNLFKEDNYTKVPYTYINQVRGLLLLLKAHCLNGTNNYFFQRKSKSGINYAELSRLFIMDRDTIEKYLTITLDGGLAKKIPNGISIMDRNIFPYFYTQNYDDEFYMMLCNWCKKRNIYPPSKEKDKIGCLFAHYPLLNKDIILLAKQNQIEPNDYLKMIVKEPDKYTFIKNYLPYQLTVRRVQPKDGYLTWKYLFKALNLKLPEKPQPINCNLYIM